MATELADEQLIAAVRQQDHMALMTLYDRYNRLAFALAYRMLADPGAAEEAVQDAFLQVWRRASTFDPTRGSGVRAWLLTIVHHRAIDLMRRKSSRAQTSPLEDFEAVLSTPDAWGEASATLDRDTVRSAVAELPVDQQRAIELAYFDGLSHREIAERTGMPLGTVKGRLRLGLQKLSLTLAGHRPVAG